MPPLPYLTKLDRFTIGADIFVFLAFVETIVTSHYENRGKINTAVVIDHYAKFIFPAAFILFTIVCLW
jgi:cadmium resistance protein CadD (predicted permease)